VNQFSRIQIRAVILLGFALNLLAAVISFINDVNSIGFPDSFHGILNEVVNPLTALAALCAWSLLTRLEARDAGQLRILRLAYVFFAAQYFLFAVGYNFLFTPIHSLGGFWITTSEWLAFVGAVATTVGLVLMARSLVTISEIERPRVTQP
jgi:hypothetical protein